MRAMLFTALLCLSTAAMAVDQQRPLEIAAITTQQSQIRTEVQAGTGRYKNMPESTRNELLSRQAQMLKMLDGKKTSDDLTEKQRMEAFNTLEWISGTVNNTPDERLICRHERTVGSNMIRSVCRTPEQMELQREQAQQDLGFHDHVN
jgi:hypothetical protein